MLEKQKFGKRVWFNYIGMVTTTSLLSNAVPLPHDAEAFGCSLSDLTRCANSLYDQDTSSYQVVPMSTPFLARTSPQHSEYSRKSSTPQDGPCPSPRSSYRHALPRPTDLHTKNELFNTKMKKYAKNKKPLFPSSIKNGKKSILN